MPSTSSLPSHHANDRGTSFKNPWGETKGLQASGQVLSQFPFAFARRFEGNPAAPIQVVKPTFGAETIDGNAIKATWLGHAGFLVELPMAPSSSGGPTRILFDPIWSERASPVQQAGPRRRLPPPCTLEELPEFHFVITSHNHYDHLDWPTIERIFKLRGSAVHFIAPLGNKLWFESGGIPTQQITHLDWWETVEVKSFGGGHPVKITCTPAQHASGRSVIDQRASLWASWVVKQTTEDLQVSVYHAGDTGYMTQSGPCPVFKEIGEKCGPFDLSMIPIWRGGSLSFIASMGLRLTNTELLDGLHASPAHAVRLHKDIRAQHSLGMHFATFAGSDIEALEPLVELVAAKKAHDVGDWFDEGGFGVINVGETAVVTVSASSQDEGK